MTQNKPITTNQFILIILLLFASSYTLFAIFRWWLADKHFATAKGLTDAGYVTQSLPEFNQAIKLMPGEPLFHDGLSDAASRLAYGLSQNQATESAKQAASLALSESDLTIKLNPVHLNFWKTRIRVFLILAQIDPQYSLKGLGALNQAISLSPTDAKLYYNLGLLQWQLKQTETALQALEKTVDLKPDYEAALLALGQLYQELGNPAKARAQFEYILQHIAPQNQTALQALENLTKK